MWMNCLLSRLAVLEHYDIHDGYLEPFQPLLKVCAFGWFCSLRKFPSGGLGWEARRRQGRTENRKGVDEWSSLLVYTGEEAEEISACVWCLMGLKATAISGVRLNAFMITQSLCKGLSYLRNLFIITRTIGGSTRILPYSHCRNNFTSRNSFFGGA